MAGAAAAMMIRLMKARRNPTPWHFPTPLLRSAGGFLPRPPFVVGVRVSSSGSNAGARLRKPGKDSADRKNSAKAASSLQSAGSSVRAPSVDGESSRERANSVGNGGVKLRKSRQDSVDGKISVEVRVSSVDRESDGEKTNSVGNDGVWLRKVGQDSTDGKSSVKVRALQTDGSSVRVLSADRESDRERANSVGNGGVSLRKVRQTSVDGKSSVEVRALRSDGISVRVLSVDRESDGERVKSVGNGGVRLQKVRQNSVDRKSSAEVRTLQSDGNSVRVFSVDRESDGGRANSIGNGSVRLQKARQDSMDGKSSIEDRVSSVDREIDGEKVYSIGMDGMAGGETSFETRGGSSIGNGRMDRMAYGKTSVEVRGGRSIGNGGMDGMVDGKTSIGNRMEEEALQAILSKHRHRSNCLEKVEMLLEHGWTPQQVTRFCATKCYFSVKKLAGMLNLMDKWGIGPTSTLLRYPHLLNYSLKTVESCLLFFKSQGWNQDEIGKIVRACPFVLGKNVETHLKPFLRFIDDQGLIKYTMLKHLLKNSRTFQFTTAPQEKIQFLRGLGFESKSTELSRAFVVLGSSRIQRLQEGIDWFRGRGLSEGQVLNMIKSNPSILKVSQKKVGTIIETICGYLKYGLADVARNSVVLQYSLENRILPRCKALAQLREEGFATETLSIRTIFSSTDARFEKLIESITTRNTSIKGKQGTDPKDAPKSRKLKG